MGRLKTHLRNKFVTGLLAAIPVAVTLFIVWYVDSHGSVYKRPLRPDVAFSDGAPATTVEQVAEKWLLSTAACSQTR